MKLILSFIMTTALLSATNCVNLNVGNAALTTSILCKPVTITPVVQQLSLTLPTLQIPTSSAIKCSLPTVAPTPAPVINCTPTPVVVECTPTPVSVQCAPKQVVTQCAPPVTPICTPTPVIECPAPTPKCPTPTPSLPNCAAPEPGSFALLGAGLLTAGLARKFRK